MVTEEIAFVRYEKGFFRLCWTTAIHNKQSLQDLRRMKHAQRHKEVLYQNSNGRSIRLFFSDQLGISMKTLFQRAEDFDLNGYHAFWVTMIQQYNDTS